MKNPDSLIQEAKALISTFQFEIDNPYIDENGITGLEKTFSKKWRLYVLDSSTNLFKMKLLFSKIDAGSHFIEQIENINKYGDLSQDDFHNKRYIELLEMFIAYVEE
ncbi:hypothetical protein [Aquirufa nivalisilvae]|uniref:hypothetical protein n=1 Tax=Aquirufa nivalisilvae TaxID=2516557 RepID=UPI0022A930B1|nr:hypothetical protein [Aquirufa nivalisilvae]MCZ2480049.1 hypothetical protein [Aquirufa nivalisilvae]